MFIFDYIYFIPFFLIALPEYTTSVFYRFIIIDINTVLESYIRIAPCEFGEDIISLYIRSTICVLQFTACITKSCCVLWVSVVSCQCIAFSRQPIQAAMKSLYVLSVHFKKHFQSKLCCGVSLFTPEFVWLMACLKCSNQNNWKDPECYI